MNESWTSPTDRPAMRDPGDPLAALDPWSEDAARERARALGITLGAEHLRILHALRDNFRTHPQAHAREMLECMERIAAPDGNRRHLYALFPGGPVRQACELAGLPIPPGASDPSFGNVM